MKATAPIKVDDALHVETNFDTVMLDWNGDGKVKCEFDGTRTHVHNDGETVHDLYQWWDEYDQIIGLGPKLSTSCPLGMNQLVY